MEGDIKILSWPTLDPYFRRSFEELERDFKPEIWKNMEKCSDRYSWRRKKQSSRKIISKLYRGLQKQKGINIQAKLGKRTRPRHLTGGLVYNMEHTTLFNKLKEVERTSDPFLYYNPH